MTPRACYRVSRIGHGRTFLCMAADMRDAIERATFYYFWPDSDGVTCDVAIEHANGTTSWEPAIEHERVTP